MTDDTLESRLARLEALLDRVAPASPAWPANRSEAHASSRLDASVLDGLAATADRLKQLAAEIDSRTLTEDWDAADRLTARLLTEHLAAAVRDCRIVTNAAAEHLGLAERAVSDIEHALDRQRDREAGLGIETQNPKTQIPKPKSQTNDPNGPNDPNVPNDSKF